MAPRVDFYLIDRHVEDGRMRAACRLCKKIQSLGHRVFVQTPDQDQARALDDLMWTFDQSSFVPHELYDPKRQSGETLIAIGQQAPRRGEYTVLVSLLETVPESYDVFPRVVELVDNVPEDRTRARERYRWYRDRGCTLDNHDISV